MAANVVKLVNNTKAILKVDDRVDEGSKHFVTSGAVDTAITTAKNDIIGDASEDYNTLGKIENAISTLPDAGAVVKTTYNELKTLRDSGSLLPGTLYRITDYQCTTTQENTRAAGHQFDIVLLALSENKLAEEGWAMIHENIYDVTFNDGVTKKCYLYYTGEEGAEYNIVDVTTLMGTGYVPAEMLTIDEETKTAIYVENSDTLLEEDVIGNYFQNSNLSAWKVWYCLDNDTSRFAWAANIFNDATNQPMMESLYYNGNGIRNNIYIRYPQGDNENGYAWMYLDSDITFADGKVYILEDDPTIIYFSTEYPIIGTMFADAGDKVNTVNALSVGTGVIYRLIDEWNNDCPYDFKNIQFKRPLTNGAYDIRNGIYTWVYTFNTWYNECYDLTITSPIWTNDENICYPCMNNKINTVSDGNADGIPTIYLPGNVFITKSIPSDTAAVVINVHFLSASNCTITCSSGETVENVDIYYTYGRVYSGYDINNCLMVTENKKVVFEDIT